MQPAKLISLKATTERVLQHNINFEDLLKLGIAKEQSQKGAELLEKASGQDPLLTSCTIQEVCCFQLENQELRLHKPTQPCFHCSSERLAPIDKHALQ